VRERVCVREKESQIEREHPLDLRLHLVVAHEIRLLLLWLCLAILRLGYRSPSLIRDAPPP
jgi:hypothetical protein